MSNIEKLLLALLSLLILALAVTLMRLYRTAWRQPLAPALAIPFRLPPTWTPNSTQDSSPPSTPEIAAVTESLSPTESVASLASPCGGASPMFILLIGSDARANSYQYGLADVIRLARVDFQNLKVTILDFPRDLWVQIPDIADNLNGQNYEKLNQAYLYGNPGFGYSDDPAGGPGLLARTLTLNFGAQIDQYVAVNMRTFEKIVDAVGGVDVVLPHTVDGRTEDDRDERLLFEEGAHHLNGEQALMLSRIRIKGVFTRADHQSLVLCALRDKLVSPGVIARLPNLIEAFRGSVQTSLSLEQLSQLACLGTQIEPQHIIFGSFPRELFESTRVYDPVFGKGVAVWKADFTVLRDYAGRFTRGEWPQADGAFNNPDPGDTFICK
jgi:LCP family protein required for cell wall assembly